MKNYMCFLFVFLCGCANIVPPSGGEKDTVPPKLIFSSPENKKTNFLSNEIILRFDEYVQIKNLNEINLSPPCKNKIEVIQKGKELRLLLNCVLDSETTYTINFGNSIVDLNEGNVLKNFKYIFSTGSKIDSLKLIGATYDLYSSKIIPNSLVGLYQHADSLNPYYYTFSEKDGHFEINNIKSGVYLLYAIVDKNGNLKHDQGELISFPKTIENFNTDLQLSLFNERASFNILNVENTSYSSIAFNHTSVKDSIKILNSKGIWKRGETKSEFWFKNGSNNIKYQLGSTIDSIEIYNTDTIPLKLHGSVDFHKLNKYAVVNCNKPISAVDPKLFKWHAQVDCVDVNLIDAFSIKIPVFDENNSRELIIPSGAIKTIFDEENDSVVFNFDFNRSNYAILNIKHFNPLNKTIVEIFKETETSYKKLIVDTITSFNYIKPGTYSVRLFQDINNDGAWSAGSISKNIKPEPIQIYPQQISLKANWELDIELQD